MVLYPGITVTPRPPLLYKYADSKCETFVLFPKNLHCFTKRAGMWEIRAMKEKEREHQTQIKKDMEWAFAWACLKPPMSHLQQTHHLLQHANVNSNGYGYYSLCSVKGTILLLLQRRFVSSRATILTLRHTTAPLLRDFIHSFFR